MLEVTIDDADEHALQYAAEAVRDHGAQLARAGDHEVVKWRAPMGAQEPVDDAAHVRRHLLVDAALEAGLRPAALCMSAVKLIGDRRELSQSTRSSAQQTSSAAAHDGHAPGAGGDRLGQRLEPGDRVDDRQRLDGLGEKHRLEKVAAPEEKIASARAPRTIVGSLLSHASTRSASSAAVCRRAAASSDPSCAARVSGVGNRLGSRSM